MADKNKENCHCYLDDSKIDGFNVTQLKDYLRRHNQYVTGKKSELIGRAKGVRKAGLGTFRDTVSEQQKFDRRKTDKLTTPLGEILPHPNKVSQWSVELLEVPEFTERDLYNYFVLKMKTKKPLRSRIYYEDRHVYNIMYSDISNDCQHCFLKCYVMPSIPTAKAKDNPDHEVWVCLSKVSGAVHSAECDCAAGSGEACNHIGALLYALVDINAKKKDGTLASTSQKCVWDQFRKFKKRKLTPKKSSELSFKKEKQNSDIAKSNSDIAKSAKQLFKVTVNKERFRSQLAKCNPNAGWLLNFVKTRIDEKVPQLLNVEFNYSDHVCLNSELVVSRMDSLVNGMKFSDKECERLEKLTRGQNKNIVWGDERHSRLTASNFGEVLNIKEQTPPEGIVKRIMYPNVRNKYTVWGQRHEAAARMKYQLVMRKKYSDITVQQTGLFVGKEQPYLGASPDGIVSYTDNDINERSVLEIKCPASDKWKTLSPEECSKDPDFYMAINPDTGLCALKRSHKYYYQVQGQMALTGLKWCDFVIWTLGGISIERIHFDHELWSNMTKKLAKFYKCCILPELFSKRVRRGLKLY